MTIFNSFISINDQPISNWRAFARTADSMREFTMFTAQRELANRNFAAASAGRNEQKGFFIAGVFPSLPISPFPDDTWYAGYQRYITGDNRSHIFF